MCRPASFIITPSRVLWHPYSDYHSKILTKYEIKDDSDKPDFVKVEIVPPNKDYKLPIEKWEYSVDSDQKYFPEWYNSEEAEKACREELKHWYAEKVITKGSHTFSGLVYKIILGGNIIINDLRFDSEVCVYGKSKLTINNMKGGCVDFLDNSIAEVNNQTGGNIRFWDNSTGELNNQIGGSSWFYENSTGEVNNHLNGEVLLNSNSNAKINNQSSGWVVFYENSTGVLTNQTGGKVRFWDDSTGTLNNQSGGEVAFYDTTTWEIINHIGGDVTFSSSSKPK